jgi:hypothetical protein
VEVNRDLDSDLAGALEYEATEQAGAPGSPEYREGLRAFLRNGHPNLAQQLLLKSRVAIGTFFFFNLMLIVR